MFRPRHPEKYAGDAGSIVYRSEMERVFMSKLDASPDVLAWASEPLIIPWADPATGRQRRYVPDFLVKRRGRDGVTETILVEVKMRKESPQHARPEKRNKTTKRFIAEVMTIEHNRCKWQAAERFCAAHGMKFMVLTETELGPRR